MPNVTPVDAAHMNHIEDGIVAVDTKPSAAITYIGAYDPAHTYADGDYVIGADGITYQCVVGGTVGVTPVPFAPAPVIPYGTSLPASPVDGLEAVLVDSTTNPTYQWRFRYNAGSTSAYKWEFIGGAPKVIVPNAFTNPTVGAWNVDTAAASTITVPRAGDYITQCCCNIAGGSGTPGSGYIGYPAVAPRAGSWWTGSAEVSIFFMTLIAGMAAGGPIQNQFFSSLTNALFNNRELSVQPVRVS